MKWHCTLLGPQIRQLQPVKPKGNLDPNVNAMTLNDPIARFYCCQDRSTITQTDISDFKDGTAAAESRTWQEILRVVFPLLQHERTRLEIHWRPRRAIFGKQWAQYWMKLHFRCLYGLFPSWSNIITYPGDTIVQKLCLTSGFSWSKSFCREAWRDVMSSS